MHEKTPFQWTGLAGKLGAVVALCLLPDPYWFDGAAHAARSGTNKSNGRLMFRGITKSPCALKPNSLDLVLGKPLFRSVIELCKNNSVFSTSRHNRLRGIRKILFSPFKLPLPIPHTFFLKTPVECREHTHY